MIIIIVDDKVNEISRTKERKMEEIYERRRHMRERERERRVYSLCRGVFLFFVLKKKK